MDCNAISRARRRLVNATGRQRARAYRLLGPVYAGWLQLEYLPMGTPRWLSMRGPVRIRYTVPGAWLVARESCTPDEHTQLLQEFYNA